ncbi:MAG: ATP cone domain-containing protein [Pseudomonadota bacterium]|nr:ribonucleoside-triphosphate reductase [Gammaproteobacteria bacterium]MBU1559113.1 ribonucleoside-triphosphate reductase [Gammaproteobacteria bacterium]MBU1927011.1 ribonucleoside-triphosphate reductase [Gammaproteobacteria bacterium]MBU2546443.1 ribonucleoside-triphosphate reductase [Gammaproteobacteria bacterium]
MKNVSAPEKKQNTLLKKTSKKTEQTTRTTGLIQKIQKRDGSIVPFDLQLITKAIHKAMAATGEGSFGEAELISNKILAELVPIAKRFKNFMPTVEGVQDAVEKELILSNYVSTAKAYILYRERRAELRRKTKDVPEHIRKLAEESKKYFRNTLSEFVFLRTYARWIDQEGRRETWIETVDRYIHFMKEQLGNKLTAKEYSELREAILQQEIMPSMRLLQFAGTAAKATQVCAYNCSFTAPASIQDFAEVMYILMCGAGVGFSVESKNIQALPQIKLQTGDMLPTHLIGDSKEGWCDALALGMQTWMNGQDIQFDYSRVRPAGARLKTIGGKSSGPEPLRSLLDFTRNKIMQRQGRRLTNLDAHDILCKIGEVVVSGGVRRSAMISLSDLDDADMRDAKKGQFYITEPQRSIANNSAVYNTKPTNVEFLDEWIALMKSGSGERGIFNRGGLINTMPERRLALYEEIGVIANNQIVGTLGTNPCGEIILRPKQFCNLSEVVARPEDDEQSLLRKIHLATILGTYQSTLTDFPYLSKAWKNNCEEERLLGVSITGQWDCPTVRQSKILEKLRKQAIKTNTKYAKAFGINASTSITCVKPSGTVSQTVDCASGMHPRYAPYYIRRIRISATDSLFKMLKDQGVPYHPEVGQAEDSATTYVLDFPAKAPEGAIVRHDIHAIDQLEHWKMVKKNYTEHNPSVTILVDEHEWIEVANWVYKNWDIVGGLSFLPKSKHVYQLTPYEAITKEQYEALLERTKNIDFSQLVLYELKNETEMKRELACVSGACEL